MAGKYKCSSRTGEFFDETNTGLRHRRIGFDDVQVIGSIGLADQTINVRIHLAIGKFLINEIRELFYVFDPFVGRNQVSDRQRRTVGFCVFKRRRFPSFGFLVLDEFDFGIPSERF